MSKKVGGVVGSIGKATAGSRHLSDEELLSSAAHYLGMILCDSLAARHRTENEVPCSRCRERATAMLRKVLAVTQRQGKRKGKK